MSDDPEQTDFDDPEAEDAEEVEDIEDDPSRNPPDDALNDLRGA